MISEFPLFVFTTFGGLAGATYLLDVCFLAKSEGKGKAWLMPLVCLILLGVGLLGCLAHLQRPQFFFLALFHLGTGITQEALCSMLLGLFICIDLILAKVKGRRVLWVRIAGAFFGFALLFLMGLAYFAVIGEPAWANALTLPLFVFGSLAMGAALLIALAPSLLPNKPAFVSLIVFQVAFAAVCVVEAVRFSSLGAGFSLFVIAAALAVCSCAASVVLRKGPGDESGKCAWVVFVLTLASVCAARWAFYAGEVLSVVLF